MTDAEKLKMYEEVLCDIMDNFDHDEDAHRYDTPCRVCMAENVLVGKDPWTNNELES